MTTSIDRHIGQRLRLRRTELKLSLGKVAESCRVSLQTVQKYETGSCRVSAATLYDLAGALSVAPAFFFEGFEQETANAA